MSTALTVANLVIVAVVLIKDWGHRKVSLWAAFRPVLLTAVIVPFVMPGWDLTGRGGLMVLGAAALGTALGLLACSFVRVNVDATGQAWTDAGIGYATVWVVVCAARQAFIYGSQHWFPRDLGEFLVNNHISVKSFADSILLFSLAMVVATRCAMLVRSRLPGNMVASARA